MNRKQRRAEARQGREIAGGPSSDKAPALFAAAEARRRAGQFAKAEALYRQVVAINPDHAESWHYLGLLALQFDRGAAALAMIAKAVALNGEEPAFHDSQGVALKGQGRLDEAAIAHRRAMALKPDFVAAHNNLGNVLRDQGKPEQAEAAFRRALALAPDLAAIHNNLGNALKDQGKACDAEVSFRQAIALKADYANAHNNLGAVLTAQGKLDAAVASLQRALSLDPGYLNAHYNLGNAFRLQDRWAEAAASYEQALSLNPDFVQAHNNLGAVREDQGRLEAAAAAYRRALELRPVFAEAHNNLGNVLKEQGRLEEAIACYERVLEIKPDFAEAHSNLLMSQHYLGAISNAELLAAARRFGANFEGKAPERRFANDPSPSRRLRIGYVSGDFRQHPGGFLLARVLEAHDRAGVEIFCYANQTKVDALTRRLQGAADHWRPILHLPDAEAAALILRDGIDILIDLAGHTAKNRLPLFALRPAPVQVCWLGYFGTTGLGAMDYLIMDEAAVPQGEERWYSEALVRLPYGRFCYAPPDYAPAPSDPPALGRGRVTFGSFNNIAKLGPEVVALWADVLRATPGSRLVLKWKALDDQSARRRLAKAFAAAGVREERLELRGFSAHADMLGEYGAIDIALDPFPFGGGLTSCEALWMGVPVVTLPGDRPASRQTNGFLGHVGLDDCIAHSPADYVQRAAALAADPGRLKALRQALRPRMAASPLCDGALFTPTLEAAFRQMWTKWGIGQRAGLVEGRPANAAA